MEREYLKYQTKKLNLSIDTFSEIVHSEIVGYSI